MSNVAREEVSSPAKCPISILVSLWISKLEEDVNYCRGLECGIFGIAIARHLQSQCTGECSARIPENYRMYLVTFERS